MHPPELNPRKIALFLDFDGTLVDFAATPDAVVVSTELRELLKGLASRLNGALALITGRSLASLDQLLQWPSVWAAGSHGAEWRTQDAEPKSVEAGASLGSVREALVRFAQEHGLLLEDKTFSTALHFRQRAHMQPTIDAWLEDNVNKVPGLRVVSGKSVREVQLEGIHKGIAIERFMEHPPFAGRMPVYIGDDVTDEDGFTWVNNVQGISIKVGSGETNATYRLEDYNAVCNWLTHLLEEEG